MLIKPWFSIWTLPQMKIIPKNFLKIIPKKNDHRLVFNYRHNSSQLLIKRHKNYCGYVLSGTERNDGE